ncbi:hypothetical protein [Halanaerobacter jeridensis]|uniref:DUF2339 domain-containing protein n=1 Tax=Halanaerobacter jeridensis TaxID=706427 RepID=A0A938XSI1_9FIRM|nr:hypothetical protein [Halanaerobacter jeridensis]MBM7555491.1 hypothetical protein [Halanaerobacter jeridensis]
MDQEQLEKLIKKQNQLTKDYELLLQSYDVKEIIKENEDLNQELRKYERELRDLEEHLYDLRDRNERLRLGLKKQIIDERMELLKISRKKLELYFSARANDYKDRLTALEDEVKGKLSKLDKKVEASLSNDKEDIMSDIEQLTDKIDKRIKYRKKQFEEERVEIKNYYQQGQEELANREVEDKDLEKRRKENDLTEKVGLDWIKKLSFIVIVISIASLGSYAYMNYFNQHLKIAFIYLLGLSGVGIGEFMPHKQQNKEEKIARGLMIIGLFTLYFASFKFWGNNLLAVSLVTLFALYLVVRHYSQSIYIVALIGGYSPILLQIFNIVYNNAQLTSTAIRVNVIYTLLSFIIFSLMLFYVLSHYHSLFQFINQILLGINSLISFVILYYLVGSTYFNDYIGIIPFAFALFYWGIDRRMSLGKYSNLEWKKISKILSVIFLILIPVVQLKLKWWALIWLFEGGLITAYLLLVKKMEVTKYSKEWEILIYFKYFAVVSAWGYLMYFSFEFNDYAVFLVVIINFILAYALQNIELLNDKLIDYISVSFYIIGDFICMYATLSFPLIFNSSLLQMYSYWGLVILSNVFMLINMRKIIIAFLEKYKYNLEFYPLSLGSISVLYLTLILTIQFDVPIAGLAVTIFYFAIAFAYILYGFYRKFIYARLLGLGILVLVMFKFFIYDLSFLVGVKRLIAYLILGVSLLIIYISYQKLKNKIAN